MAKKDKTIDYSNPEMLNRIVVGASISGNISMESNLRMDGYLKGVLDCKGKLVLGKTGEIEGDVVCSSADIEGLVQGDLVVLGTLFLKSSAKILGNIKTQKLIIENGAQFNGNCEMKDNIEPSINKNEHIEEKKSEIIY